MASRAVRQSIDLDGSLHARCEVAGSGGRRDVSDQPRYASTFLPAVAGTLQWPARVASHHIVRIHQAKAVDRLSLMQARPQKRLAGKQGVLGTKPAGEDDAVTLDPVPVAALLHFGGLYSVVSVYGDDSRLAPYRNPIADLHEMKRPFGRSLML